MCVGLQSAAAPSRSDHRPQGGAEAPQPQSQQPTPDNATMHVRIDKSLITGTGPARKPNVDAGARKRESSAPAYRKFVDPAPPSSKKFRAQRSTHVDAKPSRERSTSKRRTRSNRQGRRDVSRGPDPRTPAPDLVAQRQANDGMRDRLGPIGLMSIHNVFDETLGASLEIRGSFFNE